VSDVTLQAGAAIHHVCTRQTGGPAENRMQPENGEQIAGDVEQGAQRQQVDAPTGGGEARSGHGSVPGSELPPVVYVSVLAAFAWILLASWVAFAGDGDADLALSFVLVLALVFFALPILIYFTAKHRSRTPAPQGDFLSTKVETWTGTLTAASAWLQILLIPAALAFAATLIGAANMLVH
jgi:hypothetical protein